MVTTLLSNLSAVLLAATMTATDESHPAADHGAHGAHDATVHHSFEDVERWVAVFDDSSRAAWQMPDSVAAALPLAPGRTILDIGAGTGYFNAAFAARVRPRGRVFAADVEPNLVAYMLERARRERTPEVFPILIPLDEPRVPAPVDVVFICDTVHHLDDRLAYFARLHEIVAKGGAVAIVDFKMGDIPVGPPPEHRIASDVITAEMTAAGFRFSREETFLPYQYFIVFEK